MKSNGKRRRPLHQCPECGCTFYGSASPEKAARLRALREIAGVTVAEVAEITGVTTSYVYMWETGARIVPEDAVIVYETTIAARARERITATGFPLAEVA